MINKNKVVFVAFMDIIEDGPQTLDKISSRGQVFLIENVEIGSLWLLFREKDLQSITLLLKFLQDGWTNLA